MTVKKTLLMAMLVAFVASILAVSGEAAAQKKKRKRATPEQQFKRYDKDKNGFVSKEEYLGAQKGKRKKNAEKRWERMVKFAKDKEKGLTLEEFKKATVRKRKKKKKDNA
jgi:Ca2+-binding EF-hand superfamily protein